jgi:hypothetical protein
MEYSTLTSKFSPGVLDIIFVIVIIHVLMLSFIAFGLREEYTRAKKNKTLLKFFKHLSIIIILSFIVGYIMSL